MATKQVTGKATAMWARDGSRRLDDPHAWRARRVTLLVSGIVVLSLADLAITLTYLRANWMMEANPLAAYIIRTTQSPWALAAFKCCTVGVCAALLFHLRRFRSGEVAAWCGIGVLTIMAMMWHAYADHLDDNQEVLLAHTGPAYEDGRLGLP
jgi:hypothetical protein